MMRKRLFFNLILIAATTILAITAGCKDYDDDILRLESNSATKTALEAAIAELNSLKADLEDLEGRSDVEEAVAMAKSEAIDAAVAEAQRLLNNKSGNYEGTLEDLAALITVLNGDISALEGEIDSAAVEITINSTAIALQQSVLDKYLLVAGDDNLITTINEVKQGLTEVEGKLTSALTALAAAEGDIAAAEAAIAGIRTDITTLSARIDAIDEALNMLNFASINSMITEITFNYQTEPMPVGRELRFKSPTAKVSELFGTGLPGEIEFMEGIRVMDNLATIEVKVSPTNANLSRMIDKIYLIRRDGNNEVNSYIEVQSAERSTALRAAPSETGLWNITFKMPPSADITELGQLIEDEEGSFLFALAVESSANQEERYVISDFVITMDIEPISPVYNCSETERLYFSVGSNDSFVSHKQIRNRYMQSETGTAAPADQRWKGTGWTELEETESDDKDNRTGTAVRFFPVEVGKSFSLRLDEPEEGILAYKVLLDKDWAVENLPAEWNRWSSYSYQGINRVYWADETAELKINTVSAVGDNIGFRIVAVNYDGTLVDPDGKSFYVTVGAESTEWGSVSSPVMAQNPNEAAATDTSSEPVDITLNKLTGAVSYEWITDEADNEAATNPAFFIRLIDEYNNPLFTTTAASGTVGAGVDFSKAVKLQSKPAVNDWLAYIDNKTYNGRLRIKNSSGNLLAEMQVSFKKILPTVAPEGFSEKTGQFTDDLYNGYLIPATTADGGVTWVETWSALPGATHGMMMLDQLFNFGSGKVANFETAFADSKRDGEEIVPVTVIGDGTLTVASEFIDNVTSHIATVRYNWGKISTANPDADYMVAVKEYRAIYSNIYNQTYSWGWATHEQLNLNPEEDELPYSTEVTYGAGTTDGGVTIPPATVELAHIFGVSTRDSRYSAPLSAPYRESLTFAENPVKLVTTVSGLDEYFNASLSGTTVTLTGKSSAANPTYDVPSTLIIKVIDMYGNNIDIALPMTVKKR